MYDAVTIRDTLRFPTAALAGAQPQGVLAFPNDQFRWVSEDPQSNLDQQLRSEERRKERARIARDLHDTLLQGFLGASLMLHSVLEELPANAPGKQSLARALTTMRRVIDEGRDALRDLRTNPAASSSPSLEQVLAKIVNEFIEDVPEFRVSVLGRSRTLDPACQRELSLIAREALTNAVRHSGANCIEAEVEYFPSRLRVVIRDNGSGIDPEKIQFEGESHWGLVGMRERAANIGGTLRILSRPGCGTEVEVSLPDDGIYECDLEPVAIAARNLA